MPVSVQAMVEIGAAETINSDSRGGEMVKSEAVRGHLAFAQNTDDSMCHLSFVCDTGTAINIQIPMDQVADVIQNLVRVYAADRRRVMVERDAFKEMIPRSMQAAE
jgi:hypothetical protein